MTKTILALAVTAAAYLIASPEDLPEVAQLVVEHFRPATNEDFIESTTR